jgi:hypothetical protein
MNTKEKIINLLECYYKEDNTLDKNSIKTVSEVGGIGAGIGGTPVVQQTKMPMPEPQLKKTPGLEKILDLVQTEDSVPVKTQMKKLKKIITSGKKKINKKSQF